jgi:hypothetical protein
MAQSVSGTDSKVPVSVVLDSGIFLEDIDSKTLAPLRVGYFMPTLYVFGDGGDEINCRDLCLSTSESRALEVRAFDPSGGLISTGVTYTGKLRTYLLRRKDLYSDPFPDVIPARFDWIVSCATGSCRPSNVKLRTFKEINGYSHQPTGETQTRGPFAHDVVLEFDIEPGGRVEVAIDGTAIWTGDPSSQSRFDIELISPHSSAECYFRDALNHRGKNYWLPNQGDPQPMGVP